MKILLSLFLAAFTLAAQAPRAQGHAYFGIDNPPRGAFDYSNYNSIGVGADIFLYKGTAFTPTGGWLYTRASIGRGAAAITLNASYHFLRGKGRFEPFVTAGYGTLTNFGDVVSLLNCGAEANFGSTGISVYAPKFLTSNTSNTAS